MILTYNNKWLYKGRKVLDKDNVVPPQPTIYYVTTSGVGGSVVANPTSGIEGTEVSLSNTPSQGYQFNSYSVSGATLKSSNKFDIEQSNVNVVGNFDRIYNVNVTQSTGGSISASPTQGLNGTQVTLSNTPSQGYTFGNYNVTGATLNNNKFTINNSDVNVSATFNKIYNVSVTQPTGGSISASPLQGINGTTVTLSNTPNQGYQFNKYVVSGATLYNGNKFNINGSNVSVTAQFNTIPASALLVNLGSTEYSRTSKGITDIPLTGKPSTTTYNYIAVKFDFKYNYGSKAGNSVGLYLKNSSGSTLWRMRANNSIAAYNTGYSTTYPILGYAALTGAITDYSQIIDPNRGLKQITVDNITYYSHLSLWSSNHPHRTSPPQPEYTVHYNQFTLIFDRNNKKGYITLPIVGKATDGPATLNVDPYTMTKLQLQIETSNNLNNVDVGVKNVKVAGFKVFDDAISWSKI